MLDKKRKMPHDFTYMFNMKDKSNEQTESNRSQLIDAENKRDFQKGWELGLGELGEEIMRYKLPVIN